MGLVGADAERRGAEHTSLAESPGEKALHELAVAAGLSSPAAPCPRDLLVKSLVAEDLHGPCHHHPRSVPRLDGGDEEGAGAEGHRPLPDRLVELVEVGGGGRAQYGEDQRIVVGDTKACTTKENWANLCRSQHNLWGCDIVGYDERVAAVVCCIMLEVILHVRNLLVHLQPALGRHFARVVRRVWGRGKQQVPPLVHERHDITNIQRVSKLFCPRCEYDHVVV
mmetsp:Transcript_10371/g.24392  ORF Transcript_10371/g.24392 Transcript_10371/m.24392 type:complete len:224 (-) Transcript_10371:245-916(-)